MVLLKNTLSGVIEYELIDKFEDVCDDDKFIYFKDIIVPDIFLFGISKDNVILDPIEEELSILNSTAIISHKGGMINHVESIGSSIDFNKIQEMKDLVQKLIAKTKKV